MDIIVTMASGEEDRWEGVADAVDDRGSIVVIDYIEGDEIPEGVKLFTITVPVDQGMDLPPTEKTQTFKVLAVYAPGMWIKVEFE